MERIPFARLEVSADTSWQHARDPGARTRPGSGGAPDSLILPGAVAAFCVGLGGLVLVGWLLDVVWLKHIVPDMVAMNPLTAVSLALAGVTLWLLRRPPVPGGNVALAHTLALLISAIGLAKLVGTLLGISPGVDEFLFSARLDAVSEVRPNRMAPNTAVNLALLGLALRLMDTEGPRGLRPAQPLALGVALIAGLALLGYGYGVSAMYGLSTFFPMALHTAVAFVLLAVGVLAARPGTGLMRVFTGTLPHNVLARRLAGGTLLILVSLGWLRLKGERMGLYDGELGVTFFTAATILLTTGLIAWGTISLDRSEARRRHVEEERERFFTVTPDMMCIADFRGRLRSLNPAWERLTGYSHEELTSGPITAFVHEDDRQRADRQLADLERHPDGTTASFEFRFRHKDGRLRWFAWNAMPVADEGLFYATVRDITSRKEGEASIRQLNAELVASSEQLKQTNRELEAFTYTVSHDLRAPLRHIDGYAQMLKEDSAGQLDDELCRYLDTICLSAQRMGTLIDDLLAFSRLGRKPIERTAVDMHQLASRALVEAGSHPSSSAVAVEPLPPAHADPVLMRQVWVNLLSNAIKYSGGRGAEARIRVSGEVDGPVVRYCVRDNGVGFDMRYADKLFGVFQRMHSSDEFEGTGVGLAIVQRILTRHGGRIWADAAPGVGAAFTFEVPRIHGPGGETA